MGMIKALIELVNFGGTKSFTTPIPAPAFFPVLWRFLLAPVLTVKKPFTEAQTSSSHALVEQSRKHDMNGLLLSLFCVWSGSAKRRR